MEIKPIETYYNGYRFRSRLEARWAVFFDVLGVKYEYEPEGFQTSAGPYLPDFRVECHGLRGEHNCDPFDLWIEVKGKMTEQDAKKIKAFANFPVMGIGSDRDLNVWLEAIDKANKVLIVSNIPRSTYDIGNYDSASDSFEHYDTPVYNYQLIDEDYFGAYPAATKEGKFYLFGADSNYINKCDVERVDAAYSIARQARFEHGEIPIVSRASLFD